MPRSPSPDPEPATLAEAIETSHPERLAETLVAVCEKSAEAKAIVSGLLLSNITADSIKDKSKLEKLAGQKRKRWEACETCQEEFDVEDNQAGECMWHEGELVKNADAEIFQKKDIEIDSDIDPEDLAEDYPEAVRFTCCKKDGKADGCVKGKHRPMSAEKIARLESMFNGDFNGEDGEDDDGEDD